MYILYYHFFLKPFQLIFSFFLVLVVLFFGVEVKDFKEIGKYLSCFGVYRRIMREDGAPFFFTIPSKLGANEGK